MMIAFKVSTCKSIQGNKQRNKLIDGGGKEHCLGSTKRTYISNGQVQVRRRGSFPTDSAW